MSMKRMLKILTMAIVICGMLSTTVTGLIPARAETREIPEVFSLTEEETGEEQVSGPWHYALRKADGLAVITGFDGARDETEIPVALDGHDVVGLGSGAMSGRRSVTLHGNILWIADDAFGTDKPEIIALNGTYGEKWAERHGLVHRTGRDYELAEGVIDFTDGTGARVERRGEKHVAFGKTEGMRLAVGSIFWMRDKREMEFFFRVTELTEKGGKVIATVEIPEVKDAVVDYETTMVLTAEDGVVTPAEGVTLEESAAATVKSEARIPEKKIKKFTIPVYYKTANETVYTGSASMSTDSTIIYTVSIHDGKITKSDMEKINTDTISASLSVSKKNTIKYNEVTPDENGTLTEEQKKKAEAGIGPIGYLVNDTGYGYSFKDIKAYEKYINKLHEASWNGTESINMSQYMGGITFQTPYFNASIDFIIEFSFSGALTYTKTTTNITKEHYNTATEKWEVVYSNGRVSQDSESRTLTAEVQGSIVGKVEISVGFFFVRNLSVSLSIGVEAKAKVVWNIGNQYTFPCISVKITPFMAINISAGLWIGKETGIKEPILSRRWSAKDLGLDLELDAHINPGDNQIPTFHLAEDCPYNSALSVNYDTKTPIQIAPKTILRNGKLNGDFNLTPQASTDPNGGDGTFDPMTLEHSIYGTFLGWAYRPTDTTPTAADARAKNFKNVTIDGTIENLYVRKSITLYAVWSNMVTVHFDSNGGTAVPDQPVPVKGYIVPPADPVKEGSHFLYWKTENDFIWEMETDRVKGEMTLTAAYAGGDPQPEEGTKASWIIGDYSQVSAECLYEGSPAAYSAATNFEYSEITIPDTNAKAIQITKVKTSAKHIIIPASLPGKTVSDYLPVVDIKCSAFSGCFNLKSVRFATGNSTKLSTYRLFASCTGLEYVELPALENGTLQEAAFESTTNLKCVKFRAGLRIIGDKAFISSGIPGEFKPIPGIEKIGYQAFKGSGLNTVDYSISDMTYVSDSAFYGCKKLTKIDLTGKLDTLSYNCFTNCTGLKDIYVPDNIKTWRVQSGGSYGTPFSGCTGAETLSIGGVEAVFGAMLRTDSKKMRKITIRGKYVRKINSGAGAYAYQETATHPCALILEEGIREISYNAFKYDSMFTSVYLPTTLTSISWNAFEYCSGIGSLYLNSTDGCFIAASAFSNCRSITDVTLKGIKSIDGGAFYNCNAMETLHIEGELFFLADAFSYCSGLKEVYLPDIIEDYSSDNFFRSDKLEKLDIGAADQDGKCTVKYSGPSLKEVRIRGCVKAFKGNIELTTSDTVEAHECELIIEEGVEEVSKIKGGFTRITFPKSIRKVSDFYSITKLPEVVIEGEDVEVSAWFGDNPELKRVRLAGVKNVSKFENNPALEIVELNGVETVTGFNDCTGITKLELSDGINSISSAFCNTKIRKLRIPDDYKELYRSFMNSSELEEISHGGAEMLPMLYSNKLRKCTLRGSVKTVNQETFDEERLVGDEWREENCEAILEDGITELKENVLKGTQIFTLVQIPATVTKIGSNCMANSERLRDVIVYAENIEIGSGAFCNSPNLTVHIAAENAALANYCETNGISYDFTADLQHTLTVNSMNGTAAQQRTAAWGEALSLPVPEWSGHVFSGWYYDEEGTTLCTWETMPAQDLTLYAAWDKDVYTLTAWANNGTSARETYQAAAGTYPVIPQPTNGTRRFAGWCLDRDGKLPFDGRMREADTEIYAIWADAAGNGHYHIADGGARLYDYTETEEENRILYLPEEAEGLPVCAIEKGALARSSAEVLYIPATVTEIEDGAFAGNGTLKALHVAEGNPVYRSIDGVIYSKDGSRLLISPPRKERVTVPESVTEIADGAFKDTKLISVILPSGLTRIGKGAFAGAEIDYIRIPESVTTIGERAFSRCRKLTEIRAEGAPENIGENAFSGCNGFLRVYGPITAAVLDSATTGAGYLYNNYELTTYISYSNQPKQLVKAGETFTLPENPDMGVNSAFTGWYLDSSYKQELTDYTMPEHDLTAYAGSREMFYYRTTYSSEAGQTIAQIYNCFSRNSEVVIPEKLSRYTVYGIDNYTFGETHTQVTVPDSVGWIGDYAFASGTTIICSEGSYARTWAEAHGYPTENMQVTLSFETGYDMKAEAVRLEPGQAITLPEMSRSGYELTGWYWDSSYSEAAGDAPTMKNTDACLYAQWQKTDDALAAIADSLTVEENETGLTITGYSGSLSTLSLPATLHGKAVTAIGDYAFAMTDPVIMELPESIGEIGQGAFYGMDQLQAIRLPGGLTTLPEAAFENCRKLMSINLPEGLTMIRNRALAGTGLRQVTIPAGVRKIETDALEGCWELQKISVAAGNAFYESREGVLFDKAVGILVRYPAAKAGTSYRVENTFGIGAGAFEGNRYLQQVSVSDDILSVGAGAFAYCTALEEMPVFGSMVTVIPERCFLGCVKLQEIELTAAIDEIDDYAFRNTGVKSAVIPDTVTRIGQYAFDADVTLYGSSNVVSEWATKNGVLFLPVGSTAVSSLAFGTDELNMKAGQRTALQLTVTPANTDRKQVRFSSSNTAVATVTADGTVCAIGGGTAIIYASAAGDVSASCMVTVTADATGIRIDREKARMKIGKSMTLSVHITPASAGNQGITWSSSDPAVAEVSEDGVVTATGEGRAVITASGPAGLEAECVVDVYIPIESISIGTSTVTMYTGRTYQFIPEITPANATPQKLKWSSSNSSYVQVNSEGVVSGKWASSATITVETEEGQKASCGVKIKDAMTGFTVNDGQKIWNCASGEIKYITRKITPTSCNSYTIQFVSSREDVATVDSNGEITAVKDGFAEIQCIPEDFPELAQSIYVMCGDAGSLTLPTGLTTIEAEAFSGIKAECIIIPGSVRTIESKAFAGCDGLRLVFLPGTIESIAEDAFDGSANVAFAITDSGSRTEGYAQRHGIRYFRAE